MLGNWGVPVFSDQVLDIAVRDLLARRVPRQLSVVGDVDIFLLVGFRTEWAEIQDIRRAADLRPIRYASTIATYWLRAGASQRSGLPGHPSIHH